MGAVSHKLNIYATAVVGINLTTICPDKHSQASHQTDHNRSNPFPTHDVLLSSRTPFSRLTQPTRLLVALANLMPLDKVPS